MEGKVNITAVLLIGVVAYLVMQHFKAPVTQTVGTAIPAGQPNPNVFTEVVDIVNQFFKMLSPKAPAVLSPTSTGTGSYTATI